MPWIKQPHNYKARITPYQQRLLLHGTDDSRIYLSRSANSILSAFTYGYDEPITYDSTTSVTLEYTQRDNCVIDGLKTSYKLTGNILSVTIHPGTVIADLTLLSFPEPTTVDLDLTNYNQIGYLLVSLNYKWLDNVYENSPKFRISYITQDRSTVQPSEWIADYDRLLITYLTYDKDTNNHVIESTIKNNVPDPFAKMEREFFKIRGLTYEVAPLPNFWNRLFTTIVNNFSRRQTRTITKTNWVLATNPPLQLGGSSAYCYYDVNTNPLMMKEIMVQCYIGNFKIEPAGIEHIDSNYVRIWMPERFVNNPDGTPDITVIVIG